MEKSGSGAIVGSLAPTKLGAHLAMDLSSVDLPSAAPLSAVPLVTCQLDHVAVEEWIADSDDSQGDGSSDDAHGLQESHEEVSFIAKENQRLKEELAALKQSLPYGIVRDHSRRRGRSGRSRSRPNHTHRGGRGRGGAQRHLNPQPPGRTGETSGPASHPFCSSEVESRPRSVGSRLAQINNGQASTGKVPSPPMSNAKVGIETGGRKSYAEMTHESVANNPMRKSALVNLEYILPTMDDGRVIVMALKGSTDGGSEEWENTLVGHFIGRKLSYLTVSSIAKRIWGSEGLVDVLSSEHGFFFFKFLRSEALDKILEGGPWHFVNRPIFLKRWQPNLSLLKEELSKVPLWVKIYGLPLEYWTVKGLSAVASGIGKPLYPDRRTIEKTRIGYARVCIEVSASNELMRELDVCDTNGNSFTVYTEYDWASEVCSSCQCFGHSTVACGKTARLNPTIEKNQKSSADQDSWHQIQRRRQGKELVMELVSPPLILKSLDEPTTAELQVGISDYLEGVLEASKHPKPTVALPFVEEDGNDSPPLSLLGFKARDSLGKKNCRSRALMIPLNRAKSENSLSSANWILWV